MDAKEFELELNDLETRVDRLRALYENWFRGYEKMEPQVARKDVERRVYTLRKDLPRNTALRFRYHQLYQRYTTLANYWQRTAKQIEEGTYRLQLQRMRRRGAPGPGQERTSESGRPGPRSYELDPNESLSVDDLLSDFEMDEVARAVDSPASEPSPAPKPTPRAAPMAPAPAKLAPAPTQPQSAPALSQATPASVARPLPPPPAAPAPPPRPAALVPPTASGSRPMPGAPVPAPAKPVPSATVRVPTAPTATRPAAAVPTAPGQTATGQRVQGGAPTEERLKRLYDEYTSARRRNNEGEVRYDHLVSSIQKMLPELQKKHQGKSIDFEVVVKDGRVGLKPKAV